MSALDPREAALLRPSPDLGVPLPAYSGRSLPNLSATLFDAFGGRRDEAPEVLPPLAPDLDPFAGRRPEGPVVVVLVDGLGWGDFLRWADGRPDGRGEAWRAAAGPVTTVFPSTTTAALYSLATGAAPSRHGLLGYRQYLPRYGVVADMLKLSPLGTEARDLLVGAEWAPSDLGGPPTLARRGAPTEALTRDRFLATGFTRLLYDGAAVVGYATATDLAHELLRLLEREAPRVVFVYWDELDTIQHLKGPRPELFDLELERTVHLVEYVASHLPLERAEKVRLLLTGDHG